MTLDEKLAQLGSCWMYELQTHGTLDMQKVTEKMHHGLGQVTRVAGASTLGPQQAAKTANTIQAFLMEQTRLHIPAILHEECCSGAMVLGGTIFPQIIGLASAYQPSLAEAMTTVIRRQLRAIGAHQGIAPVLDIARDPRWGRVEETFGEDPTLAANYGVAYVRGLQGESLRDGILATGKHFIGHSLSLGGLNCAPVQIGRHDLYDICLAPFQAAIRDAGLASIMNAYPELDGEVVAASRRFLTEILRDQLGFEGLVVSDYDAILMLHTFHHSAPTKSDAARMALEAGIDVELPTTTCYGDALRSALEAGDLNIETVDRSIFRHLEKKSELGLFENPYVDEGRVLEVFATSDNRSLSHEIARRSMVLLKNDGLLPLKKTTGTLAVIGPNADEARNQLGDYSYAATAELMMFSSMENSSFKDLDYASLAPHQTHITTVLDGIKAAVPPATKLLYAHGCDNLGDDKSGFAEAVAIASNADAVILVLGDRSGLVPSCTTGETRDSADLKLPGVQEELAQALQATGKPIVVVLINGRPYALPWFNENVNAILEAWLPGQAGGAVADVLFGDFNPGGKLPITFPRSAGQLPVFYNHKPSGMKSHWYGDYVDEKVTPLFPFGHGLSYTNFEYSDFNIGQPQVRGGASVDVSMCVRNTGFVAGEEVVQLYTCDVYARQPRPVKELKGYLRVALNPGESKWITFHLPVNMLAYHDSNLNLVLEPGLVQVMLGGSSEDIRLRGEMEVIGEPFIVDQRVFDCPVTVR